MTTERCNKIARPLLAPCLTAHSHYLKASFTIGSFMTTMPQIPKGRPTQQGVQQGITARISITQTTDLDSSCIIFLQPKIKNI